MNSNNSAIAEARGSRALGRAPLCVHERRILCATDLTTRSLPVIRAATTLADRFEAQLTLLHVTTKAQAASAPANLEERLRDQLNTSTVRIVSPPLLAVREGDPAKIIAQVAQETGAGLIILGAPRKRALAVLLGTTAERVASLAQRPVLIVRSKDVLRYERVVVATQLQPSFKDVMRYADRWSFLDAARVSIVHSFQSPFQGPLYAEGYDVEAARRALAGWKQTTRAYLLKKLNAAGLNGARFEFHIKEGQPFRLVRRSLRGNGASLLVLGASDHTLIGRLIRGSLTNDALVRLDCDVLIFPTRGEARMDLH